ncbi:signal peptidase I [Paenibacillus sp. V4I5]|uniref:signal peptidase I n=1 Tax=Paenibacillus sp. V4I5 TaxID=3042306 RepID=UPI0027942618|nr:signal peptidase I [Paenibacillus sp. V4I5]MDQ0914591.1 signal peptidase I [Paenibacillus sp. V4I5]
MNKVAHIMIFLAFVLLTGCSEKQPITDELTKYDLPITEKLDSNQIIHVIKSDGMYRSEQYSGNSQLVIDRGFYDTKEINRGDVVYFDTKASDEQIKNGNQTQYDVARVIGLPGEMVTIQKGQVFINNRKLDTFYGKEYFTSGFINGTEKAHSIDEVKLTDGQYFLVGDVWWRSSFNEHVSKDRIKGKIVGWMKKK